MNKGIIKVMSYNIRSGRGGECDAVRDYDRTVAEIARHEADIIGIQEVGNHPIATFAEFPMPGEPTEYLMEKTGYNGYFACAMKFRGKYPYGNALLTRHPIKSARTVIIPDPDDRSPENDYFETRSVLVAEIDVLGGVTVLVSHFGLMPSEKVNAVNTVCELIKEIKTPIIFMGDLNMTPDDPTLAPIFKIIRDIENEKNEPKTWPATLDNIGSYESEIKKIGSKDDAARKIDYIFISDELHSNGGEVTHTLTSDHLPYIAYIEKR